MKLQDAIRKGLFLGKYITGKETREEHQELKSWTEAGSANKELFKKLTSHSEIATQLEQYDSVNTSRAWNKYQERIRQYKLEKSLFRWRIAAILFFIIGIGGLIGNAIIDTSFEDTPSNFTTVSTINGESSKITLPDQSTIWLNGGTSIQYSTDFSADNREISLDGEAYFQVAKNRKLPFVVDCDGLKVRVLGTSFNVSNYADDETISVVLEQGAVELSPELKSQKYDLKPGEKADYNRKTQDLTIRKVDTYQFTSWKKGLLIFKGETMREVVKKLERWYNVSIDVRNPEIYELIFTATILHEDVEEILELIRFSCSINYNIVLSQDPDTPIKITMY